MSMSPAARTSHWAAVNESTFSAGIWLLLAVYRVGGRWLFRLFLWPVVLTYWLLQPRLRHASLQYLQRLQAATGALGHVPGRRDSIRHVLRFAETMLDKLLAVSGRYTGPIRTNEVREELLARQASGNGGLILTAHVGCLELCRMVGERRSGLRLTVLVHTRHAESFNRLLKRLNPGHDVQLLEVTEVGPATALLLQQRVSAGEFIVIAADRIPVRASKTLTVDFLGHPAPFPLGPWVVASLLKCPVWFVSCVQEANGYNIHFEKLATNVQLTRGQREASAAVYAQAYVRALTLQLQRAPLAWFNFFAFWDQHHAAAVHES